MYVPISSLAVELVISLPIKSSINSSILSSPKESHYKSNLFAHRLSELLNTTGMEDKKKGKSFCGLKQKPSDYLRFLISMK